MSRYQGKVCLVTAATAGIGYAIASRMAIEGGTVYICSRKQKNVEQALTSISDAVSKAGSKGSINGLALNVGDPKGR